MLTSEFLPFNGGIGAYARELALAAAAAGHEVTVLAPDYGADCIDVDAALPFRVIRYQSGPATMRTLPVRIAKARHLLQCDQFDIVHAIDWPFFIPLRLARRSIRGARALLTVHGSEILYMQAAKRRWMLDLIGFWQRDWAGWIANSRYTADLLRRSFPQVPAEQIRAIPLGLAESWKAGRIDRDVARAALAVGDDRIVMVSLGRVVPRKGHGVIAAALARLPRELAANIDWWIIGPLLDKEHAGSLRSATTGLAVRTDFLGSLPDGDVKLRLSAADLFCLPGYQAPDGAVEGFGLVFLEAGAYRVPSIASRSGGIPEAVEHGQTGLLVPERDEVALADAIMRLASDASLRTRLAEGARAKAGAATWEAVMRETYNV